MEGEILGMEDFCLEERWVSRRIMLGRGVWREGVKICACWGFEGQRFVLKEDISGEGEQVYWQKGMISVFLFWGQF